MKRLAWILICLPLLSLACGEEDKDTSDTGAPEGDTDTDTAPDTDTATAADAAADTDTDTDADTDPDPLEIIGEYDDAWGTAHLITADSWSQEYGGSVSLFAIDSYDNDGDYLVAQNDEANDWSPGLWSRFDWTDFSGDLYFCQTAYDAASADDALATPAADATDPTTSGCGGFSWSQLIGR